MKYAFILFLAAFISCNSTSKNHKIKPDTCFTYIEFKNIYAGGYPPPPATSTAVRIIKDSLFEDTIEDKRVHRPDTTYFIGYNMTSLDPKDSTHRSNLKSKIDPTKDSLHVEYYPIRTDNLIRDYNITFPIRQAQRLR